MRAKIDGVAFLGLREGSPRTVQDDIVGRPCDRAHLCATGPIRALSLALSPERGAAAIYDIDGTERPGALARRIGSDRLQYQPVRGTLRIRQVGLPTLVADQNGRGEPPWDAFADLDEDTAIELRPRLEGIRELRLRSVTLAGLTVGEPVAYEPGRHVEEILAAGRIGRARPGSG